MGRKTVEINILRGQRLKQVLNDQKMKQRELADILDCTKEHISYIVTGKRNLTEEHAKKIVAQFPHIRLEWLMGYDDFRTEYEKGINEFLQWGEENTSRRNAVKALASLAGYEIVDLWDYVGSTGRPLEEVFNFQRQGMQIKQDGKLLANIPVDKFNLLALDIQELAELRIKSYLREVKEDG